MLFHSSVVMYKDATRSILVPVVFTIFNEEIDNEIEARFIAFADKKL